MNLYLFQRLRGIILKCFILRAYCNKTMLIFNINSIFRHINHITNMLDVWLSNIRSMSWAGYPAYKMQKNKKEKK